MLVGESAPMDIHGAVEGCTEKHTLVVLVRRAAVTIGWRSSSSVVGWSGVNGHHVLFVLQDERDHGLVVLFIGLVVVSGLIVIRASMPMVVDAVGGVRSFPVSKQPLQQVPDDVLLYVVEVPT